MSIDTNNDRHERPKRVADFSDHDFLDYAVNDAKNRMNAIGPHGRPTNHPQALVTLVNFYLTYTDSLVMPIELPQDEEGRFRPTNYVEPRQRPQSMEETDTRLNIIEPITDLQDFINRGLKIFKPKNQTDRDVLNQLSKKILDHAEILGEDPIPEPVTKNKNWIMHLAAQVIKLDT